MSVEEDHGQYNDPSWIFWASGAAMVIRSNIFREVKGFDEYFFAHQEEIDLCWRNTIGGL
jgi:GT2 family glycosyltransferase